MTEHKDYWNDWYEEEKTLLSSILPAEVIISHIGSTAINGIWAKPIVDILIEVPETVGFDVIKNVFISGGYILMCEENARQTAYFSYEDAKEKIAQWIDFYNNERLHGALLYLTSEDYFPGRKEERLADRRKKAYYHF